MARVLDQMALAPGTQGREHLPRSRLSDRGPGHRRPPARLDEALADGSLAATGASGRPFCRSSPISPVPTAPRCYEELREQVPPGLVEMLADLRPRRRQDPPDPRPARHRVARRPRGRRARWPPGHGCRASAPKTCENVLQGLAHLRRAREPSACSTMPRGRPRSCALRWSGCPACSRAIVAGDVRRRMELVRDIVDRAGRGRAARRGASRAWRDCPGVDEFAGQDERRATLRFAGGSLAQVVVTTTGQPRRGAGAGHGQRVAPGQAGRPCAAGSSATRSQGAALWRGSAFVPTPDEAAALPRRSACPRSRRSCARTGASWSASAGLGVPARDPRDLRGFLHCHTDYSDGSNSIEELALGLPGRGVRYLGITDHSRPRPMPAASAAEDLQRAVRRDRRGQPARRRHPGPQGHRGGHPAGRLTRLRR